jgi:intracellular sulfur oxidation DsrE/DsrF family protein
MIRHARVAAVALAVLLSACAQLPTESKHRLVVQVSDDSPKTWNQALNNARNVQTELGKDNVDIRIVVYGNGIGMLKLDSEVAGRVKQAVDGGITVVACENTMKGRKIARADMLPYSGYVKAGIVEIMQRQRDGYVYVRP